ncbi:MAG: AzlC family ABC transporter permease [Paraglaciecola sp.]|uniref:AzlC family ABC transporter permease n=1 Tax=Paraglaciecola sp. TaxID=1920173 RepID=UPI003299C28A
MSQELSILKSGFDSKVMLQAMLDIAPLSIAVVPWGILCGSLAVGIGLSGLQAQLMSLFIFAGAAQLAATSLMGAAGSLSSIFSSTFVISARHLLYSAVFRGHVRSSPFLTRVCTAFFLTDEMFAVTCAYIAKHKRYCATYAISLGVAFYVIWNLSTLAGIVLGQHLPNLESLGLEFAIAATFIAIVIPSIKAKSTLIAVVTSGVSVLVLSVFAADYALIVATILGMLAGYFTAEKEGSNE